MLQGELDKATVMRTGLTLFGPFAAVDWKKHAAWMEQMQMAIGEIRQRLHALEQTTPDESSGFYQAAHDRTLKRVEALEERMGQLPASRPGTASPTTDSEWGAPEQASTTPTDSTSLPSPQPAMPSGPAEQSSGCAHQWGPIPEPVGHQMRTYHGMYVWMLEWCPNCGALKCDEAIAAPAVLPTTSISQKLDSGISVDSEQEDVPSQSSELSKRLDMVLHWQDNHDWLHGHSKAIGA